MTRVRRPTPAALAIGILLLLAPCAWAQWVPQGAPACTTAGWQGRSGIASGGDGGAVIAWRDDRDGGYHVYAQRFDSNGNAWWKTNGVPVCTELGDREYPAIAPDGGGGAIVAWRDRRGGDFDVYVQRVGALGSPEWADNGVLVCGSAGDQAGVAIVADGMAA